MTPTLPSLPDLLARLGVPLDRVRLHPAPGTATFADLLLCEEDRPVVELTGGTLVEKAMGQFESWLGSIISGEFYAFLKTNNLGMLYGESAVLQILPTAGRAADVAYVPWADLPGGRPPPRGDRIPAVVPALVVEVLSHSNTRAEMKRKRGEYFRAGVKVVWEIETDTNSARVFTADDSGTAVPAGGMLRAESLLPGFALDLAALFAWADQSGMSNS